MNKNTYLETLYGDYGQQFTMDNVLFEQKTDQWHLVIFENAMFGRVMALDGIIQTTEKDEFIYHEMLTHVPVLTHGAAKRVLIIGGGDGGMLREVVKHKDLEAITMVEIDGSVVDMCKTYLPNHSNGAYDDPRVNLVISDGLDFVRTTEEKFDVIISDCTDPVGPGEALFRSEFYEGCQRILTENGIFVAQNGVGFMQPGEVELTTKRVGHYFADTWFYGASIPTYIGGIMTFAWGAKNPEMRNIDQATLETRFAKANIQTRYYTPAVHKGAFALPRYLEELVLSAKKA